MQPFVSQIAVFLAAALLALPAGWCCAVPGDSTAAVERQTCCRHAPPAAPADTQRAPVPPADCCCIGEPATASPSSKPADAGAQAGLGPPIPVSLPLAALPAPRGTGPIERAGPSLHALLCVWRN